MILRLRGAHAALVAAITVLALVSASCGDDEGEATGATGEETTGAGGAVDVTLQEFAVIPAQGSAPAGDVTFNVTNKGPDDVHEFVVIQTDLAPDALPTNKDGSVDEEGKGIEPQDEIEDIPVGDTQNLTVNLAAGNYVLICNIYDEDEHESHYQEGMRVSFTVE